MRSAASIALIIPATIIARQAAARYQDTLIRYIPSWPSLFAISLGVGRTSIVTFLPAETQLMPSDRSAAPQAKLHSPISLFSDSPMADRHHPSHTECPHLVRRRQIVISMLVACWTGQHGNSAPVLSARFLRTPYKTCGEYASRQF